MGVSIQENLMAPPASGAFSYFPENDANISRKGNLCQICARALLIWHIWTIW
jgi:hypothetical protein